MKTYNTGKVQIGLTYQSSVCAHHDADALRLQSALLNKRVGGLFERIAAALWGWL